MPITTVDHAYTVFVKTSDADGAGTNAKVSIALPHSKPPWSFRELDNKDVDDFEAGQTDRFFVQLPVETLRGVPPVTWPVERLALQHDNTGDRPGWFVEWVKICDGKVSKPTNACRTFTFNRWLATDEGDKQLVAEGRL